MAKKLSNVVLMPAVEGISRKIALRREKCIEKNVAVGHLDNVKKIPGIAYMGVVSRMRNVNGVGQVRQNFLFIRKSTAAAAATSEQLDQRANFAAGLKWVKDAWTDLNAITNNQMRYKEAHEDYSKKIEGVSAYGYQNMRGWMSAIAIRLKAAGKLPETHVLPEFDA